MIAKIAWEEGLTQEEPRMKVEIVCINWET